MSTKENLQIHRKEVLFSSGTAPEKSNVETKIHKI